MEISSGGTLPMQGHFDLGAAHSTGDGGRLVRPQVDDLKVDGRRDEQLVFI